MVAGDAQHNLNPPTPQGEPKRRAQSVGPFVQPMQCTVDPPLVSPLLLQLRWWQEMLREE